MTPHRLASLLVSLLALSIVPLLATAAETPGPHGHPALRQMIGAPPDESIPADSGRSSGGRTARTLGASAPIVVVDCVKGESINDALAKSTAADLTIQVQGICTEDVLIERDSVTLTGTSSANPTDGSPLDGVLTDGIRGVRYAVLTVRGARAVNIQKLSIGNGRSTGVQVMGGTVVAVSYCEIFGNGDGAQSLGSMIRITNSNIHDNTRSDVSAWFAGDIYCGSCTLTRSRFPAMAIGGSRVMLNQSTIQNSTSGYALLAMEHGYLSFANATFDGSIDAEDASQIVIDRGTQTGNPAGFWAAQDSHVTVQNGSSLLGPVELSDFANLTLRAGSSIVGDLACYAASNAFCVNPSKVSGGVSGCSACVKP